MLALNVTQTVCLKTLLSYGNNFVTSANVLLDNLHGSH